MSQHPKLESVPSVGDGAAEQRAARRQLELEEEVAELRLRVTERIERERVITLELAAARQDLEVKSAYNVMLESAALERHQHVTWLQNVVDQLTAERAVTSAELASALQRLDAMDGEVAKLAAELAAERARLSYRLSHRLISWLARHRLLARLAGLSSRERTGRRS